MAYAPYSGYRVGAALCTTQGEIFTGANIENASFSMTICAERVAVFRAVMAGEREFEALAVTSSGSGGSLPVGLVFRCWRNLLPGLRSLLRMPMVNVLSMD